MTHAHRILLAASLAACAAAAADETAGSTILRNVRPDMRVVTNAEQAVEGRIGPLAANLNTLDRKVDRVMTNVVGSNVYFSVHNYLEPLYDRRLTLNEYVDGASIVIWDESSLHDVIQMRMEERIQNRVGTLREELQESVPDPAWANYTSGAGAAAPDDTVWVSSKQIVVAPNHEFRKVAGISGNVEMLCTLDMGLGIETNGTFWVKDASGNAIFEMRSNTNLVANFQIDDIETQGDVVTVSILRDQGNLTINEQPRMKASTSVNGPWLDEAQPDFPYYATWSLSGGAWVVVMSPRQAIASPVKFYKAVIKNSGGHVEARYNVPINPKAGILCTDGVHVVRPVYSNGTITWSVQ